MVVRQAFLLLWGGLFVEQTSEMKSRMLRMLNARHDTVNVTPLVLEPGRPLKGDGEFSEK